ncbi:hypothetical protein ERJ75_001238500 [Trypanosoma vivax]|nr:hypothetical protein ERJ75_001238500 [Trypanosoma vivax]
MVRTWFNTVGPLADKIKFILIGEGNSSRQQRAEESRLTQQPGERGERVTAGATQEQTSNHPPGQEATRQTTGNTAESPEDAMSGMHYVVNWLVGNGVVTLFDWITKRGKTEGWWEGGVPKEEWTKAVKSLDGAVARALNYLLNYMESARPDDIQFVQGLFCFTVRRREALALWADEIRPLNLGTAALTGGSAFKGFAKSGPLIEETRRLPSTPRGAEGTSVTFSTVALAQNFQFAISSYLLIPRHGKPVGQ